MMSTLLASTLGAVAVMGQSPDLRVGDCVKARDVIEYEHMDRVEKGWRGMVTGKGILWQGRKWEFQELEQPKPAEGEEDIPGEKKYYFKQRNAVIHRSMVEKIDEGMGYGPIRRVFDAVDSNGKPVKKVQCLTAFDIAHSGKKDQSSVTHKVQWWQCEQGWIDQMFILPACGFGPGQIRFAKDPETCLQRQIKERKLVISPCDWTQPFIFRIVDLNPLAGQLFTFGSLTVGTQGSGSVTPDAPAECFAIASSEGASGDPNLASPEAIKLGLGGSPPIPEAFNVPFSKTGMFPPGDDFFNSCDPLVFDGLSSQAILSSLNLDPSWPSYR